jgi:hypothetical protein
MPPFGGLPAIHREIPASATADELGTQETGASGEPLRPRSIRTVRLLEAGHTLGRNPVTPHSQVGRRPIHERWVSRLGPPACAWPSPASRTR